MVETTIIPKIASAMTAKTIQSHLNGEKKRPILSSPQSEFIQLRMNQLEVAAVLLDQLVSPFELEQDEIFQPAEHLAADFFLHDVNGIPFLDRGAVDGQLVSSPSRESLVERSLIVVWYFSSFARSVFERSSKYET